MCFLDNMEKSCNLSEVFMDKHGKSNYQKVSMEIIWRHSLESDTFYGDGKINLELICGFHAENMLNQITRQCPY